jgi:hypothetical protein
LEDTEKYKHLSQHPLIASECCPITLLHPQSTGSGSALQLPSPFWRYLSLSQAHNLMAQTSTSAGLSSATTSSTYNVFSAIASNGNGGTYGVQPGNVASDPTNQAGQNAAGASGSSDGSLNLSTGATVAIIVIVVLVVLIGGKHPHSPSTRLSR